MALGHTAGVAKITIRPDLSRFKESLDRQIAEALHDRVVNVRTKLKDEGNTEATLNEMARSRDVDYRAKADDSSIKKAKKDLKFGDETVDVRSKADKKSKKKAGKDVQQDDQTVTVKSKADKKSKKKAAQDLSHDDTTQTVHQKADTASVKEAAKDLEHDDQIVQVHQEADTASVADTAKDLAHDDSTQTVHQTADEASIKHVSEQLSENQGDHTQKITQTADTSQAQKEYQKLGETIKDQLSAAEEWDKLSAKRAADEAKAMKRAERSDAQLDRIAQREQREQVRSKFGDEKAEAFKPTRLEDYEMAVERRTKAVAELEKVLKGDTQEQAKLYRDYLNESAKYNLAVAKNDRGQKKAALERISAISKLASDRFEIDFTVEDEPRLEEQKRLTAVTNKRNERAARIESFRSQMEESAAERFERRNPPLGPRPAMESGLANAANKSGAKVAPATAPPAPAPERPKEQTTPSTPPPAVSNKPVPVENVDDDSPEADRAAARQQALLDRIGTSIKAAGPTLDEAKASVKAKAEAAKPKPARSKTLNSETADELSPTDAIKAISKRLAQMDKTGTSTLEKRLADREAALATRQNDFDTVDERLAERRATRAKGKVVKEWITDKNGDEVERVVPEAADHKEHLNVASALGKAKSAVQTAKNNILARNSEYETFQEQLEFARELEQRAYMGSLASARAEAEAAEAKSKAAEESVKVAEKTADSESTAAESKQREDRVPDAEIAQSPAPAAEPTLTADEVTQAEYRQKQIDALDKKIKAQTDLRNKISSQTLDAEQIAISARDTAIDLQDDGATKSKIDKATRALTDAMETHSKYTTELNAAEEQLQQLEADRADALTIHAQVNEENLKDAQQRAIDSGQQRALPASEQRALPAGTTVSLSDQDQMAMAVVRAQAERLVEAEALRAEKLAREQKKRDEKAAKKAAKAAAVEAAREAAEEEADKKRTAEEIAARKAAVARATYERKVSEEIAALYADGLARRREDDGKTAKVEAALERKQRQLEKAKSVLATAEAKGVKRDIDKAQRDVRLKQRALEGNEKAHTNVGPSADFRDRAADKADLAAYQAEQQAIADADAEQARLDQAAADVADAQRRLQRQQAKQGQKAIKQGQKLWNQAVKAANRTRNRVPLDRPTVTSDVGDYTAWADSLKRSQRGLPGAKNNSDRKSAMRQLNGAASGADAALLAIRDAQRDLADATDRVVDSTARQAEVESDASSTDEARAAAANELTRALRNQESQQDKLTKARLDYKKADDVAYAVGQRFLRSLDARGRVALNINSAESLANKEAEAIEKKLEASRFRRAESEARTLGRGDITNLRGADADIAKEYLAAAKQYDQARQQMVAADNGVASSLRALILVNRQKTEAERLGNLTTEQTIALQNRHAAALERLSSARDRQGSSTANFAEADRRIQPAEEAFEGRRTRGRTQRIVDAIGGIGSGAIDTLNEKILLMGRQLSAVSAIARFAGIGLAALGAVNLVPAIASLSQMANIGALLPAIFASAGAALAAVVIGGNGIADAFKAATKVSDNAAKDEKARIKTAEQNAKQERTARRSLENAQKSQAKAATSGAKSIVNAEKSVAQAQKQAVNAQKNLTDARESAIDKIADLNDALRGNALDEEGAAQAIERAREAYGRTLADPQASSLDRREADLGIRQAVENLEQIKKRNREAVVEAREATKAGVEGDAEVIQAKEGIVEANAGIADAEADLAQARVDAAEANADAARSVADAQESLSETLASNAAEASEASTAVSEYEEALKHLSPNARAFVEQVRNLGASWTDLRMLVQDNLFGGLGDSVVKLAKVQLPTLKDGLAGIAGELNGGVRDSMAVFSTEGARLDFSRFLGNTQRATGYLADAMAPLSQVFIDLTTVGSDRLPRLGDAVKRVSERFADLVGAARDSGRLDQIIDQGITKVEQFGRIVADVAVSVRRVFQAVRPEGDDMLTTFEKATQRMRDFLSSAEGQNKTRDFFDGVHDSFERIATIAGDVWKVFSQQIYPAFERVAGIVATVVEAFVNMATALLNATPLLEIALTLLLGFKAIMGLKSIIMGVKGALETFALQAMITGDKVAASQTKMGAFSSMMGGPMVIGIMAAVAAFAALYWASGNAEDKLNEGRKAVERYGEQMLNFRERLQDALNASNGIANESVRGILGDQVENFRQEQVDVSGTKTNFFEKGAAYISEEYSPSKDRDPIGDFFDLNPFNNNDKVGELSEQDQKAAEAGAAFDALKSLDMTNGQISDTLVAGDSEWESFKQRLIDTGNGGQFAADKMQELRDEFIKSRDGASQTKTAIDEINRGFFDAATAVDKLTQSLAQQRNEALIVEDAQAAAGQALINFQQLVKDGFDPESTQAFIGDLVDMNGEINKNTESGLALYQQVSTMATAWDEVASSAYVAAIEQGKTSEQAEQAARDAVQQMVDGLRATAGDSVEAQQAIDRLLERYGMTPESLDTKVFADTAPAVTAHQDLLNTINNSMATMKINFAVEDPAVRQDYFGTAEGEPLTQGPIPISAYPGAQTVTPEGEAVVPGTNTAVALPPQMIAAKDEWQKFVDSIQGQYAERIQPALDGVRTKIAEIADAQVKSNEISLPAMVALADAVLALDERFKKSLTESIIPAWGELAPKIMTDALTISTTAFPMIEKALDSLVEKFSSTAMGISTAWDALRGGIAAPINWVIDNVINGGLKNAWNDVRTVIPSLPEWSVTSGRIEGFHTGGIMSGYSPGVDDRIIAVGGGEAIMRPEVTRALGPAWVNQMNKTARMGGVQGVKNLQSKWAGQFNTGGIVGSMESVIGERWPSLLQGGKAFSAYRNEPGSYHQTGQAGDFSNGGNEGSPEMQSLAQWIRDNFLSSTLELIHHPFNHNIGDYQDVGTGLNGYYDAATMEQHRNHVHWALDGPITGEGTTAPIAGMGPQSNTFAAAANSKIRSMFIDPVESMVKSAPDFGGGYLNGLLPKSFMDSVVDVAKKAVGTGRLAGGSSGSSLDTGVTPWDFSAGVEQWDANIRAALAREGFEVNDRNVALTKAQMTTESGGDPNILQTVQDVNSGGNEAMGLMQVVPGTFAAHRNPDLPNDRTNPDASLSAALRYYRSKYGEDLGTMWGQGHGYDQGGVFENGTVGWNTSGKPEAVFTNDQWMKIDQLIEALTRPDIYDALTNGSGRIALQSDAAGVSAEDTAALGTAAGELTESADNLVDYQDGQLAAVEGIETVTDAAVQTIENTTPDGQALNAQGVPTNFRPEDSYKGSTAPIKPQEESTWKMTPWMQAVTGLGKALARPDMGQRLSDPFYYDKLVAYAKDRNAQSDAAFAAGNDELGRALSDFDPSMGYDPGAQAQIATMGTQEEMFSQWQAGTAKNFENYFRENWQGMLGSAVAGVGGATYNIGSIQTNSWESAQRRLDRSARRATRSNSRAGGR
nr:transglycosylase SLT domain-containing protein [Rhodococcus sp. (in: high G+C Gram-positive bacteria)]